MSLQKSDTKEDMLKFIKKKRKSDHQILLGGIEKLFY